MISGGVALFGGALYNDIYDKNGINYEKGLVLGYAGNSSIPSGLLTLAGEKPNSPMNVLLGVGQGYAIEEAENINGVGAIVGEIATPIIDAGVIEVATTPILIKGTGILIKGTAGVSRVGRNAVHAPRKAVTGMDNRGFSSLAEQKYDAIRSLRMSDVESVATNTGLTVSEVTTMKKHLFFGKHQRFAPEVGGVVRKRFDANDDIAEAWLKAQNRPLDARQQQWFRQLRDHELGERSLMGSGVPFQDVSAWQRTNGQWEHVYREGLRGAHELAPRPPKFWPFFE
jgi:hypothetical protein